MRDALTVLLVEDNPDITTIISLALRLDSIVRIFAYASGAAAITAAAALSAPVDVMLIDMQLVDMNGIDLFKLLRELPTLAAVPAIFLTASVRMEDIDRYEKTGAKGVIAKPFDPLSLGRRIRDLIVDDRGWF